MKKLLIAFLLCSSLCSAAITGPYPVGPGVTLPAACAKIARVDIVLYPTPYVIVSVSQFVSQEALTANVSAGTAGMGDMPWADFITYVQAPLAAGQIATVEAGIENWLIRTGGPLQGWTKIQ